MDIIKDNFIKNKSELLALGTTKAKNGLISSKDFVANAPTNGLLRSGSKTLANDQS